MMPLEAVRSRAARLKATLRDQGRQLRELPWRELDVKEAGTWPASLQALMAVVLFVAAGGGAQWFLATTPRAQHHRLTVEESQALQRFETLSYQAVNLAAMERQMAELDQRMQQVLRMLPGDAEVPALLDAISDAAREQQLDIDSITLRPAVTRDFYLEQPFDIEVRGGYHQIAAFLARVAAMPRIVTLHDFTLKPAANGLHLSMLAKTYRYRDEALPGATGGDQ
ncbi:type IV pilus inner membrane component PilO [Salinicola avicenniae]|uniref:type 4a pilus biogenesis protein PilO n=1 Tax=Salinicola avicenniae TaxID=2916836 RepID=UPI0020745B5A|nr:MULTISPECIES: type 4a pilus biogenesis protein PilO [unclassified Salinicola]